MSSQPVQISRKEFSSDDVFEYLDDGRRVLVTVGVLGVETEVTLRKTDGEYVCDTGFKLFTYERREEMKQCIERLRLVTPE